MEFKKLMYQNETVHRNLTHNAEDGVLSCGFLWKPKASDSQRKIILQHYGAFLLLDGLGHYKDSQGHEYDLMPGAYVQRLPGRVHTTLVEPNGRWLEFFVCFGKKTYDTLKNLGIISDTPVIYPGISPETFQMCQYLMELFRHSKEAQSLTLYFAAQEFAADMFRYARSKGAAIDSREAAVIRRAQEMLCNNKEGFMNARQVAAENGVPYERFRKNFKAVCGVSPGEYQLDSRINYSKTLLLDTSKNLNEIALLCGFSDNFAYSKAFKKRTGLPPSVFRNKH